VVDRIPALSKTARDGAARRTYLLTSAKVQPAALRRDMLVSELIRGFSKARTVSCILDEDGRIGHALVWWLDATAGSPSR